MPRSATTDASIDTAYPATFAESAQKQRVFLPFFCEAKLRLGAAFVAACCVGALLASESAVLGRSRQALKALRLSSTSTRSAFATSTGVAQAMEAPLGGGGGASQAKKRDQGSGWEYWEYRPAEHSDAEPERKWPLLVFLHGAGESGHSLDDLISTGATGCPPVELAHGSAAAVLRDSFVVVSPQTARGWGDAAAIAEFTSGLLASEELAVDEARVYCTGVSMGGAGAWLAGTTKLFAAIAPVCGAGAVPPASLEGVPVRTPACDTQA